MNDKKSFLNLTENSENQQSLKAVEEENARLRKKIAEQVKEIEDLRDENRYLKLPSAARKRERDRQQKNRKQQISELKNDLKKCLESSYTSSPSSTCVSTPRVPEIAFEPSKHYDILEEKPSRETISWSEGYLKSTGDFYRRSQCQMEALNEILMQDRDVDSVYSEDSALETPDYRDILLADKKLESDEGELEDISDAAYQKRHLKLENRERNIVNADKKIQLDSLNKLKRDNEEHNDAEAAQQFLRLYSSKALRTIEMTEEIPLTIFGALVPALDSSDFGLPWMTTQTDLRREKENKTKRNSTGKR